MFNRIIIYYDGICKRSVAIELNPKQMDVRHDAFIMLQSGRNVQLTN